MKNRFIAIMLIESLSIKNNQTYFANEICPAPRTVVNGWNYYLFNLSNSYLHSTMYARLHDSNPMENLNHLMSMEGVMVRGTWLPRAEIDRRLAEIEAAYIE